MSKGVNIMQVHMRRLVEVIKDIDGFKENYDNTIPIIIRTGEYCHGRFKRKRILQTGNCR